MFTFTVTRNAGDDVNLPITVDFTVGGTATYLTDYTVSGATSFSATMGSILLPAGQASVSFTAAPVPDSAFEPNETIILTPQAQPSVFVTGAGSSWTATITNDDSSVSLVASLQFEGVNNSTVMTDSTGLNTWTSNSSAAISTVQFHDGSSSLLLDNAAKTVSSPWSANLSFVGDFEWSGWIYPTSTSGGNRAICGTAMGGSSGNAGHFVAIDNGNLIFRHWINGTTNAVCSGVVVNTWQSFKAVRVGTALTLYLNNVQGSTGTAGATTPANQFTIGGVPSNGGFASNFLGYLDNLLLKKL
jgi:hypothetical protein